MPYIIHPETRREMHKWEQHWQTKDAPNTDAQTQEGGLTSFADILTDAILSTLFTPGVCSVCEACDEETFGLTYLDPETGGRFCLLCLESACKPLEDGPEDPELEAIAREVIAARRALKSTR